MLIQHRTWIFCLLLISFIVYCRAQDTKENTDFKLAIGLYNDGMYDLAIDQLHNFIATYQSTPQAIEARFYLGLAELKSKKYAEARETFQNFALSYTDNPKAAEAWLNVGKSYEAAGDLHEAGSAYERVKTFYPKSALVPDALLMAGSAYSRNGELDGAKNCFKAILRDYASSKPANKARMSLGEVYAREGQFQSASREIEQSRENASSPEDKAHALFALGILQYQHALYATAESTFTTLLSGKIHNSDELTARYHLGQLCVRKHNYPQAISHFRSFLDGSSKDDTLRPDAWLELGQAYLQTRSYKNASSSFENVSVENGSPALLEEAALGILRASIDGGDMKSARATLQRLSSFPDSKNPKLLISAARDAENMGEFPLAVQLYNRYINRFPDNPSTAKVMLTLAGIYTQRQNNQQRADDLLNRIMEKFPNTPAAPAALREIAENAVSHSEYRKAIGCYHDLLAQYPGIEYADSIKAAETGLLSHRVTSTDSVIQSAIRILGDIADSTPRGSMFYKLGLLYENGLKDFITAKKYYLKSLASDPDPSKRAEVSLHIIRCLEQETWDDRGAMPEATSACDNFLKEYPSSPHTDEVVLTKYTLESSGKDPRQAAVIAKDYLTRFPRLTKRSIITYDLATASLRAGDTATAFSSFSSLLTDSAPGPLCAYAGLNLGRIMATRNQLDSAMGLYRRAMGYTPISPATANALSEIAELSWNTNARSAALGLWERLSDEFGYTTLGQTARERIPDGYLAEGNDTAAIRAARSLMVEEESDPTRESPDPGTLSRLAEAYEKHGDYGKAASIYRTYLLDNPEAPLATNVYLALGSISKSEGEIALAAAYFREASALGMNINASPENADLLFENGQYKEAGRCYITLAMKTDTTRKQYYQSRAVVSALREDDLQEGDRLQKQFRESLSGNPAYLGETEYERGLALYRKQLYAEARKSFERVKDDFGKTRFGPWGWYYLGKISEVLNKPGDAADTYDDILKKFPSSDVVPRILLSLGNMHFNAERYEQAISYYQKIISDSNRAGDTYPYALNNLIEAYESLKLYDAALNATRQYILRYPNDDNILDKKIKIGTLYTRIGYYDQAVQQFQSILAEASNADEPELFYDIGEAYYNKGDYQQAILEFLKVPYATGKSGKVNWTATALYMAGQSYEKLTKFEEAISMYQQIIDRPGIDPTFKASARKEISRVKALINK